MDNKLEQTSETIAEDKEPISKVESLYIQKLNDLLSQPSKDHMTSRCYYTIDARVFLAIPVLETLDSFLVAAATRLTIDPRGMIHCEPVSSEPIIRYLKSAITYVTHTQPKSRYHYYTFLRDHGRMILPDYLTDTHISEINEYIEEYETGNSFLDTPTKPPRKKEVIEVPGASEYAFKPLITSEKIH